MAKESIMHRIITARNASPKHFINIETNRGLIDLWRIRKTEDIRIGYDVYEIAVGDGRLSVSGNNTPMQHLIMNSDGVEIDPVGRPVKYGLVIHSVGEKTEHKEPETIVNNVSFPMPVRKEVYIATIAAMVGTIRNDDDHQRIEQLASARGMSNSQWIAHQAMKQALAAEEIWKETPSQ